MRESDEVKNFHIYDHLFTQSKIIQSGRNEILLVMSSNSMIVFAYDAPMSVSDYRLYLHDPLDI